MFLFSYFVFSYSFVIGQNYSPSCRPSARLADFRTPRLVLWSFTFSLPGAALWAPPPPGTERVAHLAARPLSPCQNSARFILSLATIHPRWKPRYPVYGWFYLSKRLRPGQQKA